MISLMLAPWATATQLPDSFSPRAKELITQSDVPLIPCEYQLNVVYFLGNDREPEADYERRLSELLLFLQRFYAQEMNRHGFGYRSFGLDMKDNGMVNIHVIRGKEDGLHYSDYAEYGGGGNAGKAIREIDEYYAAHPGTKKSEHTFILMPTQHNDKHGESSPGGVPFFGWGKCCFAVDYNDFELKYWGENSELGHLLTKWFGGFAHELAHGLNMPHNDGTASDKKEHGTPLLNNGNYTFGSSATYLTKASACIADCSQTFAPKGCTTEFYPKNFTNPTISNATIDYGKDGVTLEFDATGTWKHANVYMQMPPYQINCDYDAVAFCATVGAPDAEGKRHVSVTMPFDELHSLDADTSGRAIDIILVGPEGYKYRSRIELDMQALKAAAGKVKLPEVKSEQSGY